MRGIPSLAVCVAIASLAGSCNLPDASTPETWSLAAPHYSASTDIGSLTEYSGVPQPGKFVICTSQASPAFVPFLYQIEVVNALPSDKFVEQVIVYRGTCVVVFETRRRGGPIPEINVTAISPGPVLSASVLFDYRSLEEGFSPGAGYPTAEFFDFTNGGSWSGTTMKGFEGAVLKVFYIPAILCPATICTGGGHGGGGTLQFSAT